MLAGLALAAFPLALAARGGAGAPPEGSVRLTAGGKTVFERKVKTLRRLPARKLDARLEAFRTRTSRRGGSTIVLRTDRRALRVAVRRAVAGGGGTIELPERPVAASTPLPVLRQALRNNCETAALSMLLAARGVKAAQLNLQRALPRSGPLDPALDASGNPVSWGDPQVGFVGRPDGGGQSGGYGVYERPVSALARRRGVRLVDISGSSADRVYRRLLAGRPVMVWVGLSDGPYATWRTPNGRPVTGNFGEHTVVLTGVEGGYVDLNDPLVGQRTSWTRERFERMWQRLGRRALST